MSDLATAIAGKAETAERLAMLQAIEKKLLWLSSWTIHNANHLRPSRDKLKVGGHQASCASVASIMTALYFDVLRPERPGRGQAAREPDLPRDPCTCSGASRSSSSSASGRSAARSPIPSRTKDKCGVDFSTGSVGLGAAMTLFASLIQDYVRLHGLVARADAGRAAWSRSWATPSSTRATSTRPCSKAGSTTSAISGGSSTTTARASTASCPSCCSPRSSSSSPPSAGDVVTLKYGKRLQAAFARPGGEALRHWIDACPNDLYAALCFKGGAAWRAHLESDLGRNRGDPRAARRARRRRARRPDDEPRRARSGGGARGLPRRRGRPAALLHRLHGQGLGPALRRPQGQPRRADERRADGRPAGAPWRARRARNGRPSPAWTSPQASSIASWTGVPFARRVERHRARTPCRSRPSLPQGRRARPLDPGGVRADHGRARAQRPAAGRDGS